MHFHHFALEVSQLDRSIQFYRHFIGFQVELQTEMLGEQIAFLTLENMRLELIQVEERTTISHNVHLAFEVQNMLEVTQLCHEENVIIIEGPYQFENGWESVFILGPDEELIELIKISPSPPSD